MAKGRMVNVTIAKDARLNGLSLEAEYVYLKSIPHLDRDGLIEGDPEVLWGKVCPKRRKLIERMDAIIQEWVFSGLVLSYQDRGENVLWFMGFSKNQMGMRYDREARSIFMPPPDRPDFFRPLPVEVQPSDDTTPANLRQSADKLPAGFRQSADNCRAEVEVEVEKEREREKKKESKAEGDAFSVAASSFSFFSEKAKKQPLPETALVPVSVALADRPPAPLQWVVGPQEDKMQTKIQANIQDDDDDSNFDVLFGSGTVRAATAPVIVSSPAPAGLTTNLIAESKDRADAMRLLMRPEVGCTMAEADELVKLGKGDFEKIFLHVCGFLAEKGKARPDGVGQKSLGSLRSRIKNDFRETPLEKLSARVRDSELYQAFYEGQSYQIPGYQLPALPEGYAVPEPPVLVASAADEQRWKAARLWNNILDELRMQLLPVVFDQWLSECFVSSFDDEVLQICVPCAAAAWLESMLPRKIERIAGSMGLSVKVEFIEATP